MENNYYLLCVHAVFMGTTTASRHGGGGDASCWVMVLVKPEVRDETELDAHRAKGTQPLTTLP